MRKWSEEAGKVNLERAVRDDMCEVKRLSVKICEEWSLNWGSKKQEVFIYDWEARSVKCEVWR